MKVCFITFGCRLNKAEALQMEADYIADGWEVTDDHKDANLFIVRGCSVTRKAAEESERTIAHLHRHYPTVAVRVCGCLKRSGVGLSKLSPALNLRRPAGLAIPVRTARAYLKVQDGCAGKCSFCIVPQFRGTSTSVPFPDLLDHARRFIDAGYREIVVTGCNLSLYASEGKGLPDLVAALAGLDRSCRIRLGSLEPGACATETVHAMAANANVCRFLHLTVQSGSSRILSLMRRSYGPKDVSETVGTATRLMPLLGLGCDLIAGFPDERELDFEATKSLLKRYPFVRAHVFPFSARPGTPAAVFPNQIPRGLRAKRARELMSLVQHGRKAFAQKFLWRTVEVVVESEEKPVGWTGEYFRCEAEGSAPRKSLVQVVVTNVEDDHLSGRVVTSKE